jgi:tRNA-modifying protein YgfZ
MRRDYGDVTSEYLALRNGGGYLTDFSEIVWATGPDAVTFVDGQASQDVAAMTPGGTARSFFLGPKGKLVALSWLLRGAGRVGMIVERGRGADLVAHLEQFKFRVDVGLTLDERPVSEGWGPDLRVRAELMGLDAATAWIEQDGSLVALLVADPLSRLVLVGSDSRTMDGLGLVPVGAIAADAVRIEAGEPSMGVDVDERTIPQESGLVDQAVSFTKGCYVGQELVARIDSRGHVNRRLVGIAMSDNVVPPPGASVVAGDAVTGKLTTVGESLAVRAPVALAMVHREVEIGQTVAVRWDSGTSLGTVLALPLDDLADISHFPNTKNRD